MIAIFYVSLLLSSTFFVLVLPETHLRHLQAQKIPRLSGLHDMACLRDERERTKAVPDSSADRHRIAEAVALCGCHLRQTQLTTRHKHHPLALEIHSDGLGNNAIRADLRRLLR